MDNVVDFFQSGSNDLSVSANAVNVYLDGQWCDFLVTNKIVFAADPDFNHATFYHYSVDNNLLPEEINLLIRCGQRIIVKSVYDAGIGLTRPAEIPIFAGYIEQVETEISSGKQAIKILAGDFSAKLKRRTVYGKNIFSDNSLPTFISGVETVFNPDGTANASKQNITKNGRCFKGFSANENESRYFTFADAVYYLLCSYVLPDELVIPSLEQLTALSGKCRITDVDVTGLNLIEALIRCCKQAGLRFKFVPTVSQSLPAEAIVFYKPQNGREVELNCQWPGRKIDASKTSIAEVSSKKNSSPLTHRYIVQGDYKIYEATFDLVKGWNPALEENDYDKYSSAANENFNQVRDVWRKWSLNEVGNYSDSPYNQGSVFDFSKIFESDLYVRKKRRFLPCLTAGQSGTSLSYYLEVSYTNGSFWWPYAGSFKILTDECGVWLSAQQLDADMWFAVLKGVLKFRITASVMSDERINFTICDGPVNSIAEVVDKVVTLPGRFKYRKISPYSIFVNNSGDNLGVANETDDTNLLVEYARSLSESNYHETERLQIKTLLLSSVFSPGDRITTSPDSRDILGVKYDNRNICQVEKVEMDFENQQSILTLTRSRK